MVGAVLSLFVAIRLVPAFSGADEWATTGDDSHRQAWSGTCPPKDYLMMPSDMFVCGLGAIGAVGMVRWWSVRLVGDCHCRWMCFM